MINTGISAVGRKKIEQITEFIKEYIVKIFKKQNN